MNTRDQESGIRNQKADAPRETVARQDANAANRRPAETSIGRPEAAP